MKQPEPSEFLLLPFREFDLFVVYRAADISRPFYVSYTQFIKAITASITPASGLLLQTNGVNNPTQDLLNLIGGTNVTITDDGAGNVTISATGSGGTYTVNNGLTENPSGNFQLGGATLGTGNLIRNTYITNDGFILRIDQTTGIGLDVRNALGTAVQAITDNGFGVRARANSGIAVEALSYDNVAGLFQLESPDTSTILPVIKVQRNSTGTVFNGMGAAIDIWLEPRITVPVPSPTVPTGSFQVEWLVSGSTVASRRGQFNITLDKGDVQTRVMHGNANGEIFLDDYGTGSHIDTPTYALGVNASNKIVEFAVPSGGGITSINADTTSAQTLSIGTSGISPNWVDDLAGDHELNIPLASASGVTGGLITKIEYDLFNNKVPPTRTITINGDTKDLSADRSWTVGTGLSINPYIKETYLVGQNQFGVLFIPSINKLYVPNNNSNTVQIFDTTTNKLLSTIVVTRPYRLGYSPTAGEVYCSSQTVTTLERIDTTTNLSLGTINVTSVNTDTFIELSPTKMYISQTNAAGTVRIIDPSTATLTGAVTGTIGSFPSGMAYVNNGSSVHNGLVAVVYNNGIFLIDTSTDAVVVGSAANPSSSLNTTRDIKYSINEDKYYIASQLSNSTLVILEPNTSSTFTWLDSIENNLNVTSVELDETNGYIFTSCCSVFSGNFPVVIKVYDLLTYAIIGVIPLPTQGGGSLRSGQLSLDIANREIYAGGAASITTNTVSRVKY